MSELDKDLMYKLGQMDGKLDQIAELLAAHVKKDDEFHSTTDERIGSIEKTRNRAIGALAVVTVLFQAGWAFLTK